MTCNRLHSRNTARIHDIPVWVRLEARETCDTLVYQRTESEASNRPIIRDKVALSNSHSRLYYYTPLSNQQRRWEVEISNCIACNVTQCVKSRIRVGSRTISVSVGNTGPPWRLLTPKKKFQGKKRVPWLALCGIPCENISLLVRYNLFMLQIIIRSQYIGAHLQKLICILHTTWSLLYLTTQISHSHNSTIPYRTVLVFSNIEIS